jgi:hypothetical protein
MIVMEIESMNCALFFLQFDAMCNTSDAVRRLCTPRCGIGADAGRYQHLACVKNLDAQAAILGLAHGTRECQKGRFPDAVATHAPSIGSA